MLLGVRDIDANGINKLCSFVQLYGCVVCVCIWYCGPWH